MKTSIGLNRVGFAAALCGVLSLTACTGTRVAQEKEKPMPATLQAPDASARLRDALAADARTRNAKVDEILAQRRALIDSLIKLFDPDAPEKQSDEVRAAAAYLLGELRAAEAAPVLANALAEQPGPRWVTSSSRYDFPVSVALIKIGSPAVPYLAENITTSEDEVLRRRSASVLYRLLGGHRRLLEFLSTLHARAEDPANRDRIERTTTWVAALFKDEEPWYH